MGSSGKLVIQAGLTGVGAAVAGASGAAASASAIILATGGAAAVVLVGWGIYRLASGGRSGRA